MKDLRVNFGGSHIKIKLLYRISNMKNNIFVFELYDKNKIATYEKIINIKNNVDITIPINYHFDFSDGVNFVIKINGIIIYDSIKQLFLLNSAMIFKKIHHCIDIDDTYCINILNFILISEIDCITKNNTNHHCSPNLCCFCGSIREITFILDNMSNKTRIDGFPECIGKINESNLTNYELVMINNNKLIYTLYGDDHNCFWFVKLQKIEKDNFISMTNLMSKIETLQHSDFSLFVTLCMKISRYQCAVQSKIFKNGDTEFCINNISFLRASSNGYYLYFDYENVLDIINLISL